MLNQIYVNQSQFTDLINAMSGGGGTVSFNATQWNALINAIGGGGGGSQINPYIQTDISNALTDLPTAIASQDLITYGYKIGDYFTGASGYKYFLADMDSFYGGYNNHAIVDTHHIVILVDTGTTVKWNTSASTSSGYTYSNLQSFLSTTALNNIKSDLITLFGGSTGLEHLISNDKLFTTSESTWGWTNTYITAMTEIEIYGSDIWSLNGNQTGEANKKFEIFDIFKYTQIISDMIWLRNINNSVNASCAGNYGVSTVAQASQEYDAVGYILFH